MIFFIVFYWKIKLYCQRTMLAEFLNRIQIYHLIEEKKHISDITFYLINNEAHPAFSLDKGNEVIDPILQLHTALCWFVQL